MKIVTILGARPQFIKASSLSREVLRQQKAGFDIKEVIINTGQHYDKNMSKVFFEEMKIPKPDYFLGIGGKLHGAMTGQMIEKIEEILVLEKPDWVVVYGDTNSTLAGAIAASKLHLKIAHIEAGLRSFNIRMPEEVNRILTDRISSILFCPTQTAVTNLINEGVENWETDPRVSLVGDVMLDGALHYKKMAQPPKFIDEAREFVLCTIHRAENTDDSFRLNQIMAALNEIALTKQVILPIHPRTKKIIQEGNYNTSDLTIIDPVGYLNMVWLIDNSSIVLTDSGGLQKEAYYFSKSCITLRDETEWVELVESGVNVLSGANKQRILTAYQDAQNHFIKGPVDLSLYGNGQACKRIVDELIDISSISLN